MLIEVYRLGLIFTAGFILGDILAIRESKEPIEVGPALLCIFFWPVFWLVTALGYLVATDDDDDDDLYPI